MLFSIVCVSNAPAQNAPTGSGTVKNFSGKISISGTELNDRCIVSDRAGGVTRIRLNRRNYAFRNVTVVEFRGEAGNDYFRNDSEVFGVALGGDGDDTLVSTEGRARFFGEGGNDKLDGSDENDVLVGGYDHDTIVGHDGDDDIFGDEMSENFQLLLGSVVIDVPMGVDGDDLIFAGDGDDIILTRGGNDTITGGAGHDVIKSGTGDDVVYCQSGDDFVHAGWGNDDVYGGSGNDYVIAHYGDDAVFGMSGEDVLEGGPGNDYLNGGSSDDQLCGDEGNDRLRGMSGDDQLFGGPGVDDIKGNSGNNIISQDGDRCPGDNDDDDGDDGDDMGTAAIRGMVFGDVNGNSVFDPADVVGPDVKVELFDANDLSAPIATLTTDNSGNYGFENLMAGSYIVRFHRPKNTFFVTKDVGGDDTVDSDVNAGASGFEFDDTDTIVLPANTIIEDVDAGVFQELDIS
jgi:Ca2+-binding RTX toxin-like protein